MVFQDEPFKFSYLETVLAAAVVELQRNKERLLSALIKEDIHVIQVSQKLHVSVNRNVGSVWFRVK